MSSRAVVIDDVRLHQRECERLFCACILAGAEGIAVAECCWLPHEKFSSKDYGEYWRLVKEGNGAIKSAIDVGIYNDLMGTVVGMPYDITAVADYAYSIAEDIYIADLVNGTTSLVRLIAERDFSAIKTHIDGLGSIDMLGAQVNEKDSDAIHAEFKEIIMDKGRALSTGIIGLDQRVGGLFRGELIIIAGRPGMGKTALLTQIGRNVAVSGKRSVMFSLEMSAVQVWARMACHLVGVEWKDVRTGSVSDIRLADVAAASDKLRAKLGNNFIIVDDVYTVAGIHQASIRLKPDIVLVDQLPDIDWYNKDESEVTWYGKALKYMRQNIARKLDIPLVVNHQLNRGVENRQDKRPTLADLRMSGEVEQRADIVWLMYRDDYYVGRAKGQVNVAVEVNTAKNRQGDSGDTVMLNYNLKEQWFS